MRDPTQTSHLQDAKQITCASPSPCPYPVSIRSYKKKDYDYLSTFPRMAHSGFRVTHNDAELLQDRSDCESDLSMTASSVGYATSISSTSSTSSSQIYAKNVIASMDAEGHDHHHHQQQQQQHQPHFLSTQTCVQSPQISADCTESGIEMKNDDRSSADVKDDKLNITGDSPGLIDEKASPQVKVPVRSQSKPKPRSHNTPAVLPKFGSWDTRNPSSGEAYTLIFRRLRDEKKSGGLPMGTSPTHSKEEESDESLSQEIKTKEPLHSNAQVRKDSSRRKVKGKSHQGATDNKHHVMRWNLCCKASVLDD